MGEDWGVPKALQGTMQSFCRMYRVLIAAVRRRRLGALRGGCEPLRDGVPGLPHEPRAAALPGGLACSAEGQVSGAL